MFCEEKLITFRPESIRSKWATSFLALPLHWKALPKTVHPNQMQLPKTQLPKTVHPNQRQLPKTQLPKTVHPNQTQLPKTQLPKTVHPNQTQLPKTVHPNQTERIPQRIRPSLAVQIRRQRALLAKVGCRSTQPLWANLVHARVDHSFGRF
jgi:hypothetical protein